MKQSCTALLHHVTRELLESRFHGFKSQAVICVDGTTWRIISANIEGEIVDFALPNPRCLIQTKASMTSSYTDN